MTRPAAAAIIDAWAASAEQEHAADPLAPLLALVDPAVGSATTAASVPARDDAVVRLLAAVGTTTLQGEAACPGCDERLDVSLALPPPAASPPGRGDREEILVGGGRLTVRVPTSADLDIASRDAGGDPDRAVRLLAAQLAEDDHGALAEPHIDHEVLAAVDAAVARLLDDAVLQPVTLVCPECDETWDADVAVEQFARERIGGVVVRLLGEVHDLAVAYGWSPTTVLALPRAVRHHHLALVR